MSATDILITDVEKWEAAIEDAIVRIRKARQIDVPMSWYVRTKLGNFILELESMKKRGPIDEI